MVLKTATVGPGSSFEPQQTWGTKTTADYSRTGEGRVIMSRDDRIKVFGIDCAGPFGDGIIFKGGAWTPGGEYVQRLRVKNVCTKPKKLKYRLPNSRYFSMAYPEVMVLFPGTQQDLDVVFRPTQPEVYDDTIYFRMLEGEDAGGFHVPVRALLETLQAQVPFGLDLGFCPTQEVARQVFNIKNTGEVPAPFVWEVPQPFSLSPARGVVPVGGSVAITCSIKPTDASVFVSTAVCKVGEGVLAIRPQPLLEMRLSAIGKYCFVVPSEERLDFGKVALGAEGLAGGCVKEVLLRNQSVVPATFKIRRVESDCDPVFTLAPSSGSIPPEDELAVKITYEPSAAGTYSCEHYEVVTTGGNKSLLTITARAVAPPVWIHKKEDPFAGGMGVVDSINFRDVEVGHSTSRVILLYNSAQLPTRFGFVVEGGDSMFKFSETRGIIPSAGTEHPGEAQITLSFTPDKPHNFYRRVFCLVENQHPLLLDVMGTGYIRAHGEIKEQRPAPLRHAHVQAFRNRISAGLGQLSPDQLDALLERDGMSELFARVGGEGTAPLKRAKIDRPLTRSGEATRDQICVASEFFQEPTELQGMLLMDVSLLDFGYVASGGNDSKHITLRNRTNAKVHVQWHVGEGARGDFEVDPPEEDIAPHASAEFKVAFSPSADSSYFFRELEAFVFFKNQRTFRLAKDPTVSPPWCLTLKTMGHSFPGEQFLARCALSSNRHHGRITFPPCHVGDAVYQTLRLSNSGNTPALFDFQPDPSGTFAVKPRCGLIPPGDFQLVCLRFRPEGEGHHRHTMLCQLNHSEHGAQQADLHGLGCTPSLSLGRPLDPPRAEETLYIRPTCVGAATSRDVAIHNASRVPLVFQLDMPARAAGVLQVSPLAGTVQGNDSSSLRVTFAPQALRTYRFRIPVQVRAIAGQPPSLLDGRQLGEAGPAQTAQTVYLSLVAPSTTPAVSFEPQELDFDVRLANTSGTQGLTLVNNSDSEVAYQLCYTIRQGPGADEGGLLPVPETPLASTTASTVPQPLTVDKPTGTLPARSRTRTSVTVQPKGEGDYQFAMLCKVCALDREGKAALLTPVEAELLQLGQRARESNLQHPRGDTFQTSLPGGLPGSPEDPGELEGAAVQKQLPLQCLIRARASFPSVVLRDVRMEGGGLGASTSHLWQLLDMGGLNTLLSLPLTPEEVRFNASSTPDSSTLPRFSVPFVPNVEGAMQQVLAFEVFNQGALTTSLSLHMPNERDIEMETWANEGEPTAEELQLNDIIDRLKVFDVWPKKLTLQPRESTVLRMSYQFSSTKYDGRHHLPILVRVSKGKQFWLDLRGVTLRPTDALLHVPTGASNTFQLHPVALGTPLGEAPLQTTEIMNAGFADLQFSIDTAPIAQLNQEKGLGYGMELLMLETPSGVIPGRGSFHLQWKFIPLEAKAYSVRLRIVCETVDGDQELDEQELVVHARGYDPRDNDPHSEEVPALDKGLVPPPHQTTPLPSQPASLSLERMLWGRVPQGCVQHRVLILSNSLANTCVDFAWGESPESGPCPLLESGVISVQPPSGRLDPGGRVLLRVSLNAHCPPRVLQQAVPCVVVEVPQETAVHSRKPKSRLESRMAEMRSGSALGKGPHSSIIARATTARSAHLAATQTPLGREAKLPTALQPPPPPLVPGTTTSSKSQTAKSALRQSSSAAPGTKINGKPGATPSQPSSQQALLAPHQHSSRISQSSSPFPEMGIETGSALMRSTLGTAPLGAPGLHCAVLHIQVVAEIVSEEAYRTTFARWCPPLETHLIPQPRPFIPPEGPIQSEASETVQPASLQSAGFAGPASLHKAGPGVDPMAALVAREACEQLMRGLVCLDEVSQVIAALPQTPRVPLYSEVLTAPALLQRTEGALESVGVDCGRYRAVPKSHVLNGLSQIGLPLQPLQALSLYQDLDEVSLQTVLANLANTDIQRLQDCLGEREAGEAQRQFLARQLPPTAASPWREAEAKIELANVQQPSSNDAQERLSDTSCQQALGELLQFGMFQLMEEVLRGEFE